MGYRTAESYHAATSNLFWRIVDGAVATLAPDIRELPHALVEVATTDARNGDEIEQKKKASSEHALVRRQRGT